MASKSIISAAVTPSLSPLLGGVSRILVDSEAPGVILTRAIDGMRLWHPVIMTTRDAESVLPRDKITEYHVLEML